MRLIPLSLDPSPPQSGREETAYEYQAMSRVFIYDTTLRDGSQGEGVNFSLQDKLLLTQRLDELGVDFVEGGYPLSNPKDFEYFQAVRDLPLTHAKVAAFGMTRRKNSAAEDDTCSRRCSTPKRRSSPSLARPGTST